MARGGNSNNGNSTQSNNGNGNSNKAPNLNGTSGDDLIEAIDDRDHRISAGAGDDTLVGAGGDDHLVGGGHNDSLVGNDGDDTLIGGGHNDSLNGGAGNDRVIGGSGNDTIAASAGDDFIKGEDGIDCLIMAGLFDEYEFIENDDGSWAIIHDGGSGADGTDVVFDIEKLVFSNGFEYELGSETQLPSGVDDNAATDEDNSVLIDVLANDDDPASGGLTIANATVTGGNGSVTTDGSSLAYDPGAAYQYLDDGDSEVVTLSYTAEDVNGNSYSASVDVTVTGTNDAPVATMINQVTNEDSAPVTVDLLSTASDVDAGDMLTINNVVQTSGFAVTPTLSGSDITIDPSELNFLPELDDEVLTFTYDVSDGDAIIRNTFTLTVEGTNDVATISGDDSGLTREDAVLSANGNLTVSDPDTGEAAFITQTSTVGTYGTFDIDSFGNWTYTLDNASAIVQALTSADIEQESFIVSSTDGTTHNVVIDVEGMDDGPTATPLDVDTHEDATPSTVDLLSTATGTGILGFTNLTQNGGRTVSPVVIGSDLTFDPAPFQDLAVGESEDVIFTYDVTDDGGAVQNTLTITVDGRNDAPTTNSGLATQWATVNGAYNLMVPAGIITDIDGDTLTYSATLSDGSALPTWMSIDSATGDISGTPSIGDIGLSEITITATDPYGESSDLTFKHVTISLVGTPDKDLIVTGNAAGEAVIGLESNDFLSLGQGSDMYVYRAGDGFDVIDDNGFLSTDSVLFTDHDIADVSFTRYGTDPDDLLISFTNSDQLVIRNTLNSSAQDQIEILEFADGSTLDMHGAREAVIDSQESSGDDRIIGFTTHDTLEGGAGCDLLQGGGGSDTYIYRAGDGFDVVDDQGFLSTDVLQFVDYNSTDATITRSNLTPSNLLIDFGSGDTVLVVNTLNNSTQNQIEQITFSDTVTLDMATLRTQLINDAQTTGDDAVLGFYTGETLEGGLGNDYLRGLDGSDTYIFNAGDGQDEIRDGGFLDTDVLHINGYASTDATFTRLGGDSNDLFVSFAGGDQIRLINSLNNSSQDQVEQVYFAGDGTTLTMADLRAQVLTQAITTGDDSIVGFSSSDTLEGGLGNDFLQGRDSSDTYIFNAGDGQDVITDNGFLDTDALNIHGYLPTDVTYSVAATGTNDLLITFAGSSDSVRITNTLGNSSQHTIEEIRFDDATVHSMADVRADIIAAQQTAGNDNIVGFSGASDTLEGGVGDDILNGGSGLDTYLYGVGDGHDTILESTNGNTDNLIISGYNSTDASFTISSSDPNWVQMNLGTGDSVTIINGRGLGVITSITFDDVTWTQTDFHNAITTMGMLPPSQTGTAAADTLVGAASDDAMFGGDGSDTYEISAGTGLTIIDDNGFGDVDVVRLQGFNTADARFETRPGFANDLVITLISGEAVLVKNALNNNFFDNIEQYVFDDGTLTPTDVAQQIVHSQQSAGDDVVTGTRHVNTLEGGLGDDTLSGGDNSDTYLFNVGDGNDVIDDNGGADTDVVRLQGFNIADATFSVHPGSRNDLVINLTSGDSITVINTLNNNFFDQIEQYVFDDGTLTNNNIRSTLVSAQQSAGADTVTGFDSSETINGGTGDDYLRGLDGSDTYLFTSGDGNDTVADSGGADTDVIRLQGFDIADASFSRSLGDGDDLFISLNSGDSIRVVDTLQNNFFNTIEQLQFDNGTLTMADVRASIIASQQTAGDDNVSGFNQADTIEGGLGDDELSGKDGSDTYIFNAGNGNDTIIDNGGADADTLIIHGHASTDADYKRIPGTNDLQITFNGSSDSIYISDTLVTGFANGIESIQFSADATTLNMGDIRQSILSDMATAGDDRIFAFSTNDTIKGGLGNDLLVGGDGADHYLFAAGDGYDTIHENGPFDTDVLTISGYLSTDANFERLAPGTDDLLITFNGSSDRILVINTLGGNVFDRVEQFNFADDAVSYTTGDILTMI